MNINKYLPFVFIIAFGTILLVCFGAMMQDMKPKAQFYIDGKGYRTVLKCIKNHTESKWGYHYGYSFIRGKFCYHYGRYTETICDENIVDTIPVK